jgi:FkbM family methyltransferase
MALITKQTRLGDLEYLANDTCIGKSLSIYGEWAEKEIEFLRGLIDEGDVVLDVGANIGTHTCSFADMVGKTGKVFAFEAQSYLYDILKKNCARLCPSVRVELFHALVSSGMGQVIEEQVDYKKDGNFGAISFTSAKSKALNTGEPIEEITIDSLHLEKCDLIKVDVEGMESDVLRGALETIRQQMPLLFFECNDLEIGWECLTILDEIGGYEYFVHVSSPYNPDNYNKVSKNIFFDYMESSVIAVPNGHPAVSYIKDKAVVVGGLTSFVKEILRAPRSLDHPLEKLKLSVSNEDFEKILSSQRVHLNEAAELAVNRLKENEALSARLAETDAALNETKELAISRLEENKAISARLAETDAALNETKELAISRLKEMQALSERLDETNRALLAEKSQASEWRKEAEDLVVMLRNMRGTYVWRLAKVLGLVKDI